MQRAALPAQLSLSLSLLFPLLPCVRVGRRSLPERIGRQVRCPSNVEIQIVTSLAIPSAEPTFAEPRMSTDPRLALQNGCPQSQARSNAIFRLQRNTYTRYILYKRKIHTLTAVSPALISRVSRKLCAHLVMTGIELRRFQLCARRFQLCAAVSYLFFTLCFRATYCIA